MTVARLTRSLLGSALLLGTLVALSACTRDARRHTPATGNSPASSAQSVAATVPTARHAPRSSVAATCAVPAPSTASGYSRMFAALPASEWGAADVSISVLLPDGRSVWLFGDTLAAHSVVHSTAIVQTRGCLHVSHAGAQLLPNDDAKHIYWIESARVIDGSHLAVTARAIDLVGTGPWDFRDGGYDRTAIVHVTSNGDVTFQRWASKAVSPAPDPGPMYRVDARSHHFGYARHAHPEARLASGRTLVTTCQNWDDGKVHSLADYRPIFSERLTPEGRPGPCTAAWRQPMPNGAPATMPSTPQICVGGAAENVLGR